MYIILNLLLFFYFFYLHTHTLIISLMWKNKRLGARVTSHLHRKTRKNTEVFFCALRRRAESLIWRVFNTYKRLTLEHSSFFFFLFLLQRCRAPAPWFYGLSFSFLFWPVREVLYCLSSGSFYWPEYTFFFPFSYLWVLFRLDVVFNLFFMAWVWEGGERVEIVRVKSNAFIV